MFRQTTNMTENSLQNKLEEHHPAAYRWARQCCQYDDELAKDTLQVTYLKILEGRAVWKEKAAFKTWLFSIIRYTAIDHLRETSKFMSIDENEDVIDTTEEEFTRDYRSIIKRLSNRQSEILLLVFYHDMTLEQAAVVTKLSIGTIRTHYDRGKKALRELLNKENFNHA